MEFIQRWSQAHPYLDDLVIKIFGKICVSKDSMLDVVIGLD